MAAGKYVRTDAIKEKISNSRKEKFKKGKIKIWNKGLTKTDARVLKNSSGGSRRTQFKTGSRPENKGKGNSNWKGGKIIH